jgi:hypothetical protein
VPHCNTGSAWGLADKMGKETTMMAVTVAGLISASSIAGMQKYLNVHYDKNGEKLASPGFSLTRCVPRPRHAARAALLPRRTCQQLFCAARPGHDPGDPRSCCWRRRLRARCCAAWTGAPAASAGAMPSDAVSHGVSSKFNVLSPASKAKTF